MLIDLADGWRENYSPSFLMAMLLKAVFIALVLTSKVIGCKRANVISSLRLLLIIFKYYVMEKLSKGKRCLNLDWLEVYCLEPDTSLRDADYYRSLGYTVLERGYGTRVYAQMFTLKDFNDQLFLEIRRSPHRSLKGGENSVLHPRSCHLRLVNRYLYYPSAAAIMQEAIERFGLEFVSVTRVDICLDFEYFDSGDLPAAFVRRYLERVYSKINQSDISAHGKDEWDGMQFNSLSWGSRNSAITTKLYDKTMEIESHLTKGEGVVSYKPYIVQAWFDCGLIDDFSTRTSHDKKGQLYKPRIWRLEFSIKSKVKGWATFKNNLSKTPRYLSRRNNLSVYANSKNMLDLFASLVDHYFHFRYYEKGKRKYDCRKKELFFFDLESDVVYKPEHPLTNGRKQQKLNHLLVLLRLFREQTVNASIRAAADILIEYVQQRVKLEYLDAPFDEKLQNKLQLLLSLSGRKGTIEEKLVSVEKALEEGMLF